jgi:hypothetical protein
MSPNFSDGLLDVARLYKSFDDAEFCAHLQDALGVAPRIVLFPLGPGGPSGGGPPRRGQRCTEQDFRLFLLLSGSRPDALKRAQLDHLCTHTLKGHG